MSAAAYEPALRMLAVLSDEAHAGVAASTLRQHATHLLETIEQDAGLSPLFLSRMSKLGPREAADLERAAEIALRDARLFGGRGFGTLPSRTRRALRGLVVVADAMYPQKTKSLLRL